MSSGKRIINQQEKFLSKANLGTVELNTFSWFTAKCLDFKT